MIRFSVHRVARVWRPWQVELESTRFISKTATRTWTRRGAFRVLQVTSAAHADLADAELSLATLEARSF